MILYIKAYESKELKITRLARAISYQIFCSYPKEKGQGNISIEKYWPLPNDPKPDRGKPMEDDEVVRTIKLLKGF